MLKCVIFTVVPRATILGDSIVKYIRYIPFTDVQSVPGATIRQLTDKIAKLPVELVVCAYKYIILSVGTNDIEQSSIPAIIHDYTNLIFTVKSLNREADIIVAAILPRPVDFAVLGKKVIEVNKGLEQLANVHGASFVKCYRPFLYSGKPIESLFAHRDGGLHLNKEGTIRLRNFFKKVLAHKRK